MKQILITVREGRTPVIEKYPDGFPVDGDARHHGSRTLKKRAMDLIATDPVLLTAAKTWLGVGTTMFPREEELTPAQIARLIDQLHTGGAARFVTYAPARQEGTAAA